MADTHFTMKNVSMFEVIKEIAVWAGYVIGGLALAYTTFRDKFSGFEWYHSQAIKGIKEMDTLLEVHRLRMKADRIDLLYSSNGGGIPRVGEKIFTNLINEAISDRQVAYVGKWDNQLADKGYTEILDKMHERRVVHYEDITILPQSMIRSASMSTGVKSFVFARVKSRRNKYYFMAVSWNDTKKYDEILEEEIRLLRADVYKMLK